ncbi:GspH/FimT family pseudopilin [Gilvimarinus algae]|uniref:Type II secretion system protein H n=1 Tax=Gilvimarinus algae TaxID=3058037 RepID=A0ABT8T9X6_9GAMM|nr:GspH/FimT family pseudopilin [Gilvimarinus sp. SDUM040014]MDO3380793.1 GspH/FimT family pseudopilin [Gilvimarinus sp. SDUM040014]
MNSDDPGKNKGFTLIELMVTLVVAAIFMAIAMPNFSTLIVNGRSDGLGEELAAVLQATRAEAVKRGRRVSLCASNADGTGCAGDWANGWLMFVDSAASDGAGATVLGAASDVLRHINDVDDQAVISATNDGSAVSFVRYTSSGQLARIGGSANTAPVILSAYVTGCQGEKRNQITIGVAGMMDVDKEECP